MQPIAQADTDAESKTLPSSGEGRQIILGKLDRIRLDSIAYDGLPLGEVIKSLMAEAQRRDPDKKGVNFILTSNWSTESAPGGAAEVVDINAIAIKILPPINDIRLGQALDAIVKVADRPIQYSIEDYGVVFTLRRYEREHRDDAGFAFPGGTPKEFIEAVEQQYKVNWSSVAEIPDELKSAHIPALRMDRDSLEPILRRGRLGVGTGGHSAGGFGPAPSNESTRPAAGFAMERHKPLEALVALYNSLQQAKPELGQLVVEGDFARPSVVMFTASRAASAPADFQMKAFPLKGIPEKEWEKLALVAEQELRALAAVQRASSRELRPMLRIHRETALLIVLGPPSFLDAVGSFVTAWHANARFGPSPPTP